MSHSQVRPDSGRRVGARESIQNWRGKTSDLRAADSLALLVRFFSSPKNRRFTLLAMLSTSVSIALSGCGGVVYRTGNSLSGSSGATTATLSDVSCGTQSLTGAQSKNCSVSLTASAANAVTVSLKSNSPALTVPTSVTVATGANTAAFNAVSSTVGQQVSVTISASAGGVTKTDVVTLYPVQIALSRVSCNSQSLTGPATTSCSVSLTAAPLSPTVVSLSSNSTDLTVPATITVAAGATSANFNATASAVSASEAVTLTAALNGLTQTSQIQLQSSTASSSSTYNVDLTWAASTSSGNAIVGYRVYRALSGSSAFQALSSALETQTAYLDSTVQNGQTYSYQVTSVDTSGIESVPSNSITVSIPN